jgi:hypothetical protein
MGIGGSSCDRAKTWLTEDDVRADAKQELASWWLLFNILPYFLEALGNKSIQSHYCIGNTYQLSNVKLLNTVLPDGKHSDLAFCGIVDLAVRRR